MAQSGGEGMARFVRWRGRKEADAVLSSRRPPVFRGFIQINLLRPA